MPHYIAMSLITFLNVTVALEEIIPGITVVENAFPALP